MFTSYHVSGPFTSTLSVYLANIAFKKNDFYRFPEAEDIWTQQAVTLSMSDILLMLPKRKQWAGHSWSAGNALHAEHLISTIYVVTSPGVPAPVCFILGESSWKSLSWPWSAWDGGALWNTLFWLPAYVGSRGLLLGFVGQKWKGSCFSKLSGKLLTCFLWSFPPWRTVK